MARVHGRITQPLPALAAVCEVRRAVGSKGRVFFIDSLRSQQASAIDHRLPDRDEETMLRRLANSREYRIVKRFHEPQLLQQRLAELGWNAEVQTTREFFIYGQATPGV